ncbi:MAG: hypothetical protein ABIE75_03425, partial [Candidatus Omnitrophota bacterium]
MFAKIKPINEKVRNINLGGYFAILYLENPERGKTLLRQIMPLRAELIEQCIPCLAVYYDHTRSSQPENFKTVAFCGIVMEASKTTLVIYRLTEEVALLLGWAKNLTDYLKKEEIDMIINLSGRKFKIVNRRFTKEKRSGIWRCPLTDSIFPNHQYVLGKVTFTSWPFAISSSPVSDIDKWRIKIKEAIIDSARIILADDSGRLKLWRKGSSSVAGGTFRHTCRNRFETTSLKPASSSVISGKSNIKRPSKKPIKPISILVVEDQLEVLKSLKELLAGIINSDSYLKGKTELRTFLDGQKAWKFINKRRRAPNQNYIPDLVFSDLLMSIPTKRRRKGWDGDKLSQKLKGLNRGIPVILFTGAAETMEQRIDYAKRERLIDAVLIKPIGAAVLKEVLEKHLKVYRRHLEELEQESKLIGESVSVYQDLLLTKKELASEALQIVWQAGKKPGDKKIEQMIANSKTLEQEPGEIIALIKKVKHVKLTPLQWAMLGNEAPEVSLIRSGLQGYLPGVDAYRKAKPIKVQKKRRRKGDESRLKLTFKTAHDRPGILRDIVRIIKDNNGEITFLNFGLSGEGDSAYVEVHVTFANEEIKNEAYAELKNIPDKEDSELGKLRQKEQLKRIVIPIFVDTENITQMAWQVLESLEQIQQVINIINGIGQKIIAEEKGLLAYQLVLEVPVGLDVVKLMEAFEDPTRGLIDWNPGGSSPVIAGIKHRDVSNDEFVEGSDGFVFSRWSKEPVLLASGRFGSLKADGAMIEDILGRPADEVVAEINGQLNKAKQRILVGQHFRDVDFDVEVSVEAQRYRAETFIKPSRQRKTGIIFDWRSLKNSDFLFIINRHAFTDLKLEELYPGINPALRELFTHLFVNIAEVINLRDQNISGARKLIGDYDRVASRKTGLYPRYLKIVNNPAVKDPFSDEIIVDIVYMIAEEPVYFANIRNQMKQLAFKDEALDSLKFAILRLRIKKLRKSFVESKVIIGPEELRPLQNFAKKKRTPKALQPFIPYSQNIKYKREGDNIFLQVRFKNKDSEVEYAYLYLGLEDDLDKTLSRYGRLLGQTYAQWRNIGRSGQAECERPSRGKYNIYSDGVFMYQNEQVAQAWWAAYDSLIRLPISKLIKEINRVNVSRGGKDSSADLKVRFQKLFRELGIQRVFNEKTWLGINNIIFSLERKRKKIPIPGRYWVLKGIIIEYLNTQYPKLFLGQIDVRAKAIKDLPLWMVTNNPNLKAQALNWLSCITERGPPDYYLEAEKISISELLSSLDKYQPKQLSLFTSSPIFMPVSNFTGQDKTEIFFSHVVSAFRPNLDWNAPISQKSSSSIVILSGGKYRVLDVAKYFKKTSSISDFLHRYDQKAKLSPGQLKKVRMMACGNKIIGKLRGKPVHVKYRKGEYKEGKGIVTVLITSYIPDWNDPDIKNLHWLKRRIHDLPKRVEDQSPGGVRKLFKNIRKKNLESEVAWELYYALDILWGWKVYDNADIEEVLRLGSELFNKLGSQLLRYLFPEAFQKKSSLARAAPWILKKYRNPIQLKWLQHLIDHVDKRILMVDILKNMYYDHNEDGVVSLEQAIILWFIFDTGQVNSVVNEGLTITPSQIEGKIRLLGSIFGQDAVEKITKMNFKPQDVAKYLHGWRKGNKYSSYKRGAIEILQAWLDYKLTHGEEEAEGIQTVVPGFLGELQKCLEKNGLSSRLECLQEARVALSKMRKKYALLLSVCREHLYILEERELQYKNNYQNDSDSVSSPVHRQEKSKIVLPGLERSEEIEKLEKLFTDKRNVGPVSGLDFTDWMRELGFDIMYDSDRKHTAYVYKGREIVVKLIKKHWMPEITNSYRKAQQMYSDHLADIQITQLAGFDIVIQKKINELVTLLSISPLTESQQLVAEFIRVLDHIIGRGFLSIDILKVFNYGVDNNTVKNFDPGRQFSFGGPLLASDKDKTEFYHHEIKSSLTPYRIWDSKLEEQLRTMLLRNYN